MNTLEDIDYLMDSSKDYRLPWIARIFSNQKKVGFPDSDREWKGILELVNDRLKNKYRITETSKTPPYELPFMHHVREAYEDLLATRPDTIEECKAIIEDMITTLKSIRGLGDIVPFSNARPDSALLQRAQGMEPTMDDVEKGTPSMLQLEKRTIQKWNERLKASRQKPNKMPWDERKFEKVITSDDTTGCRMFPNGEAGRTLSHFFLKETANDERSFDLIDFAAVEEPGVSDMMLQALMQWMKRNCRMRLKNMIEQSH